MVCEERGQRGINIELAARLFNIRENLIGINQIRSTYRVYLDSDIPLSTIDNYYNI